MILKKSALCRFFILCGQDNSWYTGYIRYMRQHRAVMFVVFFLALIGAGSIAVHETHADVTADQRAALQAQLAQVQSQIAQNQVQLANEQSQQKTLQNAVDTLNSQITEAQLEIKQRNLTIQALKDGISQDNQGISTVNSNVAASQVALAQIMRDTQQMDNTSFVELALGGTLTDLFQDADDFAAIKKATADSFTQMAAQKTDLATREAALESQQQQQNQLLGLQVAQQAALKATQAQKQQLIAETKGQESAYQQVIADQQKSVTQIEQALFSLADTNKSVSFGDMYNYAKQASASTGVEPAFILAILTEESNLGQNVGNCTYETAMSPKRDTPDYLLIMQQLGLNPDSEKVSCAQSYGSYGGAMGPAQFIPSTWIGYQSRIASASGQNPPNPWDPRTATFATALYMSDLGADADTATAERTAALKYLAGSHWQGPAYAFYGEAVMNYTQQYQAQINQINGS
jgi:membrane-bound lytic murein transglycosylase B